MDLKTCITEKMKDGLSVIISTIEKRVDLTYKEVSIKCPHGVEARIPVPRKALKGEEEFHGDIYCDTRLRTSLACPSYDKCPFPYFLEVKDGKVRSYKGRPEI